MPSADVPNRSAPRHHWEENGSVYFRSFTFPSLLFYAGDQNSPKDGKDLLVDASDVVQVSAASLLRLVVHLPAGFCGQQPLQGSGAAHSVRRAEEDAGQEAAGSR